MQNLTNMAETGKIHGFLRFGRVYRLSGAQKASVCLGGCAICIRLKWRSRYLTNLGGGCKYIVHTPRTKKRG